MKMSIIQVHIDCAAHYIQFSNEFVEANERTHLPIRMSIKSQPVINWVTAYFLLLFLRLSPFITSSCFLSFIPSRSIFPHPFSSSSFFVSSYFQWFFPLILPSCFIIVSISFGLFVVYRYPRLDEDTKCRSCRTFALLS